MAQGVWRTVATPGSPAAPGTLSEISQQTLDELSLTAEEPGK